MTVIDIHSAIILALNTLCDKGHENQENLQVLRTALHDIGDKVYKYIDSLDEDI